MWTSRQQRGLCRAAGVIALLTLTCRACGEITVDAWTPLYRGVDFTRGISEPGDGRAQLISAVRVDLTETTLEFTSNASNGVAPLDVVSQTASQFLAATTAQVAVNTSFYTPCCSTLPQNKDIVGLAVTDGTLVSPAQAEARAALLIDRLKRAAFVNTVLDPYSLVDIDTAFAGSNFVLGVGRDLPRGPDTIHPARTLVGLGDRDATGDHLLLYLVTIDAGIPGSDGATRRESAEWLMRLGAHTGANLDGGGSTIMVAEDPTTGQVTRLNASSGVERSNANHLGILAEAAGGRVPRQFTTHWFAGLPDNNVDDFSPEDGISNAPPGSATELDDDYYFAGTYPEPIGVVTTDEPLANLERAVIAFNPPDDRDLRFHFNLDESQTAADAEFRFLTSVYQQDGDGSKSVQIELSLNGNLIDTTSLSAGDFYMSPTFTALEAGATAGANLLMIRQSGGNARWTNFDFHRLDYKAVPEPSSFLLLVPVCAATIRLAGSGRRCAAEHIKRSRGQSLSR